MLARTLLALVALSAPALAQTYPSPTFQGVTLQADPSTASQAVRLSYLNTRINTALPSIAACVLAGGTGAAGGVQGVTISTGLLCSSNALSVAYGTAAGTAAQGNDSRITGAAQASSLAAVATSGAYGDLTGKPTLAPVATSGSYVDLTNKPTIPTAGTTTGTYAAGNDTRITGAAQASSLAPVATSGSYTDLSNKPTIPAAGTTAGTYAAGNDPRIVNALTTLPSTRRLGAPPTWVPIGTRAMTLPGSGTTDTTNTSWNSSINLTTPPNASITAIKLLYPGFDLRNGPQDRSQTVSGTASLFTPVSASVSTAQAATSGANMLFISQNAYTSNHATSAPGMTVTGAAGIQPGTFITAVDLFPNAAANAQFRITLSQSINQALGAGSALTFTNGPYIFQPSANVASGAPTITTYQNNVSVGMALAGTGLASGTYAASVVQNTNDTTTITLSQATQAAISSGTNLTAYGLLTPATFAGSKRFTLPPFQGVMASDPIGLSLAPNSALIVKTHIEVPGNASSPGGLMMAANQSSTPQLHEGSSASTTITDSTLNTNDIGGNGNDGLWGPVAVLGLPSTPLPAVLVLADSIGAGIGDASQGFFQGTGYVVKSLSNGIPWMIQAKGGIRGDQVLANPRGIVASAAQANITDVVIALGTNDIQSGATGQILISTIRQLALQFANSGARVWVTTLLPIINGDATTISGQSLRSNTYNTTLTAAANVGDTTLQVASNTGANKGAVVFGPTIAQNPLPVIATDTSGLTVTLTTGLTAPIANGATVGFNAQESARQQFNADMRANWLSYGFAGLIDIAGVLESPTYGGRLRANNPAYTGDGLHPSAAGVTALVSSGVLTPAMFYAVFK